MRDPVAYRCNPTHHWRTGHKYKVGNTLDGYQQVPLMDAMF